MAAVAPPQGTNPQLLTGARGLIGHKDSNGNLVVLAVATDININVRAGVRDTYVMGKLNAVSLDPTMIDCDCSIGRVVPVNKNDAADKNGGLAGDSSETSAIALGLEEVIGDILTSNALTIFLQDTVTGVMQGSVVAARFSGRTLSIGAADVATERLNFVGIYDSGVAGEQVAPVLGYGV